MWFKLENDHVTLSIYAKPNAKQSALLAITDNDVHIALHAKPQDGEANKELIKFVAKLFKLPKSHCELIRGEGSRHKQIRVPLSNNLIQLLNELKLPVKK
ncbi:DUF167 domain-containing protein [Legionella bononiensis]|uniref:UPF0235 protein I5282_06110 n=1 Tax=Legionella bononiensis TaxID=2793102 RepID=A0ABS1W9W2_9GAMM|nr:DUF167 domain-containing protein [Legionella bononiensis]MBL7480658.1 YggU family protein [Legionella bononiensis]MBL7526143.1 YggU family protein [Legionella bononiensis]MBL7563362.1 YggU family protein [Legionella bononiensis]